jgi:multiple sugar transport system ATP-binding protein
MGRAIVRRPAVYLFDEPLSNLDAKLRTQMRLEIKQLHHNVQNTIIYVTHDQVEAMTLADRIVVMRDGYIEQVGSPLEIFQNPANAFVAGFIGSPPMNLHPATIVDNADGQSVRLGDGLKIPLPGKNGTTYENGKKVIMGLRTEDIFITHEDDRVDKKFHFTVDGAIRIVEPLGNETNLHMDFRGAGLVAKSEGRRHYEIGESLRMTFDLTHLHLFDAETEQSIY